MVKIMKKITAFILAIVICLTFFNIKLVEVGASGFVSSTALQIFRTTKFAEITAPSYAVYDYDNGQFITGKNMLEKRPVASLVKMMTVYIAYEYIKLEKISLEDLVDTSVTAASTVGTTAYINSGDKFTVESALYAIIISSCNDVTVALAEHIAGTESEFVKLMNLHALGLGMENTQFIDCTGISNAGYTTAHDMALLSNAIIQKHCSVENSPLNYMTLSKIPVDTSTFRNGTGVFNMYNTNNFIKFVPGSEGLKIGSTLESMYCIAATYPDKATGRRLIVVLLGASDENVLYAETRRVFEYCLANYQLLEIQVDGELVKEDIKVTKGVDKSVGCVINGEFKQVMTIENKNKVVRKTELPDSLEAPVKKGDVIGKVVYTLDDEVIYELDIILTDDVERAGWFQIFIQWLLEWFGFE